MRKICIGIHIHAEPERVKTTLASLRANTSHRAEMVLLPDGPDEATRHALATFGSLRQLGTTESGGVASCFNRLVSATLADIIVLLESGSLVGPGWLDYLLAALESNPRNGLAGPSTNRSWNEQGVFPHRGDSPAEIARTAAEAARRFGSTARTLEPLYSLADFCYVVRREVIKDIGGADEGYGLGPCWEMDYNIRAARAGWRGVWACGAYVHRPPFTARRRHEEALRFEASKHRYQDKFCALRLRSERNDYKPHCRGDACEHFAPIPLIQLALPLVANQPPASLTLPVEQATGDRSTINDQLLTIDDHEPTIVEKGSTSKRQPSPIQNLKAYNPAKSDKIQNSEPLVSCIMPTYNRRAFIPQAINYFLRQDYPHLELIIVDDGSDPIADCLPQDARIRYIRLDRKRTIGAKRNLACSQAQGEFIVHWDDDDWYPPWRVRVQLQALLDQPADLCGSSQLYYYEAATDRAWRYAYTAAGQAGSWVAGNTLAYRRSLWARNRFPEIQVGEDTRFIRSGVPKTICDLAQPGLCVGLIHPHNTSDKATRGLYWQPEPSTQIYTLLGQDLQFYRSSPVAAGISAALPLVSCIMPTYNRRAFVSLAISTFLQQDYPYKELLVIDDGSDSIGDLIRGAPGVRYFRLSGRTSIGGKRNLACREAQGEIIAHWDDDDWYAPNRLAYQIAPILAGQAELTGLENAFVLELASGAFWATQPQLHRRMFVGDIHGGTLMYRQSLLAQGVKYPEINLAEDAMLIRQAVSQGQRLVRLVNPGVFIYIRHGHNTWRFKPGQFLDPAGWIRSAPPPTFPADALDSYRAAATLVDPV